LGESLATFRTSDGYTFYYRRFVPPTGKLRARLVLLHGVRSHGGWYGQSCAELAAAGFEVYFLDRRGSGLNTAHRGDCPTYRRLIDDVVEFLLCLRQERAFLPVFVLGISWGGKLAVGLAGRTPGLVNGVVLLCPGLKPKVKPLLSQRARIVLARRLRPTKRFPIPLNDAELFTASAQWRAFIDADPFGLHEATARFLFQSFAFDQFLKRAAKKVRVPVLLMLAGNDRIIDNAKTRKFVGRFDAITTIVDYPDTEHTLEFEPPAHPWLGDLVAWLSRWC
jgi:alpha-beta hydrolase superfamily lysophospholipase